MSNIVSVHTPLNEQTRNLISRERISQMKSGAVLINTSRGAVVLEKKDYRRFLEKFPTESGMLVGASGIKL